VAAESLILLNPRAAGGRAARLAVPIEAWAREQPSRARLHVASGIAEAQAVLAALPLGSRVAVVGGDGTLHHLLAAWRERQHVLGLCPVGTGNDTARALGVRRLAWREALALALTGEPQRMDLGWWAGQPTAGLTPAPPRPFISSLAAGFDAAVAQTALGAPAFLPGTLRYLWATFAQLGRLQPHGLRVSCDGRSVHDGAALFASTLNTRTYGSGMPAVPGARIDDGQLDLLLAGRFGRGGVLAMLPLLLAGWHRHHARVSTLRFEHLRVESDEAVPLAADGEPLPAAVAFEVGVWPGAVLAVGRA
jgi:diacylglycerol kinase family enzyme